MNGQRNCGESVKSLRSNEKPQGNVAGSVRKCSLCRKMEKGQFHLTPWNSLMSNNFSSIGIKE